MTAAATDAVALRADARLASEELADTVAALMRKADVKTRIESQVSQRVRSLIVKAEPISRLADGGVRVLGATAVPMLTQLASSANVKQQANGVSAVAVALFVLKVSRRRKKKRR